MMKQSRVWPLRRNQKSCIRRCCVGGILLMVTLWMLIRLWNLERLPRLHVLLFPKSISVSESPWLCNHGNIPQNEVYNLRSFSEIAPLFDPVSGKDIYFLEWGHTPGQLCNRLALMAAFFARLDKDDRKNGILAFNEPFSEVVYALDMKLLSSVTTAGILLDCKVCQTVHMNGKKVVWKNEQDDCEAGLMPSFVVRTIECRTFLKDGILYSASNRLYQTTGTYKSDDLWLKDRPKQVGYVPYHTAFLQPKPFLKQLVKEMVDEFLASAGPRNEVTFLAVHRRFMDEWCYAWIMDPRAHQCYPSDQLNALAKDAGEVFGDDQPGWDRYSYKNLTDERRAAKEKKNYLLAMCNFTLSSSQEQVFRFHWPELFNTGKKKFAVLMASDGQDPAGDYALSKSRMVHKISSLAEMDRPDCISNKRYHSMLAEMLALSMADFHLENSMSSCGDIVAHWRIANGKPIGSSFPKVCYEGFYHRLSIPQN